MSSYTKEFTQLRKELKKQNFTVLQRNNLHYAVYKGNLYVCELPHSCSKWRAFHNKVAVLRRAGFVWKGR